MKCANIARSISLDTWVSRRSYRMSLFEISEMRELSLDQQKVVEMRLVLPYELGHLGHNGTRVILGQIEERF